MTVRYGFIPERFIFNSFLPSVLAQCWHFLRGRRENPYMVARV